MGWETFKNLTGQQFHFLTVLGYAGTDPNGRGGAMWRVKCLRCGTEKIVRSQDLRRGRHKSCSCYRREKFKLRQEAAYALLRSAGLLGK